MSQCDSQGKTVYHSINKKFTVAQELPKLSLLTVCTFSPYRKKAASTRRSRAVLHAIFAEAQQCLHGPELQIASASQVS
jgi:hypothetical protein